MSLRPPRIPASPRRDARVSPAVSRSARGLRRAVNLGWFAAVAMHVAVAAPGAAARASESDVRQWLGLPASAPLRYLADDGTPLTFAAFAARVATMPFDAKTDAASGATTLQILAPGGQREVGAVKRLPPLDATTLDGRRIRGADLAARTTLVTFFFSTCAPCIKEVPVLTEFARRHPGIGTLAITPDPADEARAFVAHRRFDWPVIAEARAFITAAQVRGYPTWLLVARDGRILGRGTGLGAEAMRDPAAALAELEQWVAARDR